MNSFGYDVQIIADTQGKYSRLTTMQLTYPRFVHAEFMTHRVFSRNASSSRAIPVKTFIKQIEDGPAMPIHWGKNKPGMQATEEVDDAELLQSLWLDSAKSACHYAKLMDAAGAHKQVVNRILEPYQFIKVVVTATEWDNFFELRDHEDAQPEIKYLARFMRNKYYDNLPDDYRDTMYGMHLPYVISDELVNLTEGTCLKLSVARCARVSYMKHDGTIPDVDKDIILHDRLVVEKPLHASPAEHQAWNMNDEKFYANFKGFKSYRYAVLEGRR